MAEKTRSSLLGLSFLSMNNIIFMIADDNMGPGLLSVLHPSLSCVSLETQQNS